MVLFLDHQIYASCGNIRMHVLRFLHLSVSSHKYIRVRDLISKSTFGS